MTLVLIGLVSGLALHWIYRQLGKALLGKPKWRARALSKLGHDEFIELEASMSREYDRRIALQKLRLEVAKQKSKRASA